MAKVEAFPGQITIFDYDHEKRRPCDYTIVKTDGGMLMCGTPYNTAPENKEEYYERHHH